MTLAQRLLVAIGILTIATTAALGYLVREAWREAEEQRFHERFEAIRAQLEKELSTQIRELPVRLEAHCRHDQAIDSALVDLNAGNLEPGRRNAVSKQVSEMKKLLDLDELVLVTGRGEILGIDGVEARDEVPLTVGKRDPTLAARLRDPPRGATLRSDREPLAVEAICTRRDANLTSGTVLGLIGARHLSRLLENSGTSGEVRLSFTRPDARENLVAATRLRELGGITVYGAQPRVSLQRALRELDAQILGLMGVTFAVALLAGFLFSRGLARPIVSLSEQVREVVRGEPKPVRGGGGRELVQLAEAFNQAISDLSAMRKRLAATERIAARREIARRVAHEIKNPLAPIRAAVETLRRLRARNDPAFDEYFDEATRTVLDEVARISNIVSEFTRFARLPPPNPAPLDLVETVRKVIGLHAGGGAPIELSARTCPRLNADRDQLVQVVTNLVANALDAVRGHADPRILVEVFAENESNVVLRVVDNGPGVAEQFRARLFEPYATTKPEGTGLGLAIVERIVVEHGGEIRYDDAPGGGARFTVTLPVSGPTLLPQAPTSTPLSER